MIAIKKKTVSFILVLLISIALCSLVFSAVSLYYEMPMNVTIEETASLSIYVDNTPWTNGTSVGWGTMSPGSQETKTLSIKNTGNIPFPVTVTAHQLPSAWELTYDKNGTVVLSGDWLNGTLTLITSAQSQGASYYWNVGIHIG